MLLNIPEFLILILFSSLYLILFNFSKAKTYDLKKKYYSLCLLLSAWLVALASSYTVNLQMFNPYGGRPGVSFYFELLFRALFVISIAFSIFFMLVSHTEKPESKEEETV